MTREQLEQAAARFVEESPLNRVPAQAALRPELAGMRIYGPPLAGFAQARDPMFQALRREEAVGPQMLTPGAVAARGQECGQPGPLPFTREVRETTEPGGGDPSPQWLHGRIQGQEMVRALCLHLRDLLEAEGTQSVVPGPTPASGPSAGPAPRGRSPGAPGLYQHLVRAPRRLCVRSGYLRPVQGADHRQGNGGPVWQPGDGRPLPGHKAVVQRPVLRLTRCGG